MNEKNTKQRLTKRLKKIRGIALFWSGFLFLISFVLCENLHAEWKKITIDSSGDVGRYTSLAFDLFGNPGVSYSGNGNVKYAYFDGTSWNSDTVSIYTATWVTSLAYDNFNNPSISAIKIPWDASSFLFFRHNGAMWNLEYSAPTSGGYTSLAYDNLDNPAMAYQYRTNPGGSIITVGLRVVRFDGTYWYFEDVDSVNTGFFNSIAFDSMGNPAISYSKGTYHYSGSTASNDLKYAFFDGINWNNITIDSSGNTGIWTSLAFDLGDNSAISYYDATNGDLKYANYNGVYWDIITVDSAGNVGEYNSLDFDASGYPCIAYYDRTNADLVFIRYNGASWERTVVDSEGDVGQFTSLAFDPTTINPVISYYDLTNGDLKLAYWEQEIIPDPVVNSISPESGPVGEEVTIIGSNFGSTQGSVTINGVSASISSWSETEIITTIPFGASTGFVVVHTSDGRDSNGIEFTVDVSPLPNQPPVASFSYSPVYPWTNLSILFDASSSNDPDGNIASYKWEFVEIGYTFSAEALAFEQYSYSFDKAGDHLIRLTVTDDKGATGSNEILVPISLYPEFIDPPSGNPKLEYANLDLDGRFLINESILYEIIKDVLNFAQTQSAKEDKDEIILFEYMHNLVSQLDSDQQAPGLEKNDLSFSIAKWAPILEQIDLGKDVGKAIYTTLLTGNLRYLLSWVPGAFIKKAVSDLVLETIEDWKFKDMAFVTIEYSPYGRMEILLCLENNRIYVNSYLDLVSRNVFIIVPINFQPLKTKWGGYVPSVHWAGILSPPEVAVRKIIPDKNDIWINIVNIHSPGELKIVDSEGNATGLIDGQVKEDIPDSQYVDGTIVLFSQSESCKYVVKGTIGGHYGLDVFLLNYGTENYFYAKDIPILPSEIHEYTFDWEALSQGEDGATIRIDSDGDGKFEIVLNFGETFSLLNAEIDLNPDTIKLKSKGKGITAYIELPNGYDVTHIDLDTIILKLGNNSINGIDMTAPSGVGDNDNDGIPDLMVKFERPTVIQYLKDNNITSGKISLSLIGQVDDKLFAASDSIRIIE